MQPPTADSSPPGPNGYRVGDLLIDIGRQRVTRESVELSLSALSFELLLALARAAPNVLSFDQLMERVWPGLVVTPETVSQRVKLVRDAIGDDSQSPRYIAGVRGRGYRMVASVTPLFPPTDLAPAAQPSTPALAEGTTPALPTPGGRRRFAGTRPIAAIGT